MATAGIYYDSNGALAGGLKDMKKLLLQVMSKSMGQNKPFNMASRTPWQNREVYSWVEVLTALLAVNRC